MKAAILETPGIDGIHLRDLPVPSPGPGEVLVRLRAASLNYRDLVVAEGGYGSMQRPTGLIMISDGAGEIAALGNGVSDYAIGDRVVTCFFQDWLGGRPDAARLQSALASLRDGVACEYRVLPARGVMKFPAHLSWIEAATLPVAALTAWTAVVVEGRVSAGQAVLTQGTGGVSLFAAQFARAAGARVIATTSSDAKMARLAALGIDDRINYRSEPEWGRRARALAGDGVDLVVEVGGAETLKQSMLALKPGGTIALIGVVSGGRAALNLGPVVTGYVRLQGVTVGHRDSYADMMQAIDRHRIRPVTDRVFPLAEIRDALRYLKSGQHVGKVCLTL